MHAEPVAITIDLADGLALLFIFVVTPFTILFLRGFVRWYLEARRLARLLEQADNCLTRLEEWKKGGENRSFSLSDYPGHPARVVLNEGERRVIACPTRSAARYCGAQAAQEAIAVGTDEVPATMVRCVEAALAEWGC